MDKLSKIQGTLLGLAIGDAVGVAAEFQERGSFPLVTDMVGGGVFGLKKGQWTDDTSMALCLADSLVACKGFDAHDQMTRYLRWYEHGENSSTGHCFDIGMATSTALNRFQVTGDPYAGSTDPRSSGNGSLMRLAPIACYYHDNLDDCVDFAILSSKTTHASDDCLFGCGYFAEILYKAINGESDKDTLLRSDYFSDCADTQCHIINGDFKRKSAEQIFGTGYVINSLEASLWAFYHTDNFKDAILTVTNLGDDADTTAAITGQIAGAYYGLDGIPTDWAADVYWSEHILDLARQLYER